MEIDIERAIIRYDESATDQSISNIRYYYLNANPNEPSSESPNTISFSDLIAEYQRYIVQTLLIKKGHNYE